MKKFGKWLTGAGLALLMTTGFSALGYCAFVQGKSSDTKTSPLTVDIKKDIANLKLVMENAGLRARLAQTDFDRANIELNTIMVDLKKKGCEFNLQQMDCVIPPKPGGSSPK